MSFLLAAIVLLLSTPAQAQTTVAVPGATGDQLLFFFDARTDRVPFLTIGNPGAASLDVEIAFYPQDLSSRLGQSIRTIPGRGNLVVNPTQEASGVAAGHAGLAVVTPIVSTSDSRPVVPPTPLMGGYTVANTALGAGFGDSPMGRLAVDGSGQRASAGSVVDGESARYQRFAPDVLLIPTYYNPTTLDPPESDGNRVILVAFGDQYGDRFDVASHSVTARATVLETDGGLVASRNQPITAILLSDVEAIAGGAALTSSGKIFFAMDVGAGNVFGIFSQSLAAFGAGARIPAVAEGPDPQATPGPVATPTPAPTLVASPTPTPSPTPAGGAVCGNGIVEGIEDCDGEDLDNADCESEVGGLSRCTGAVTCNADCTYNLSACNCNCIGDIDCDVEIDCGAFVEFCEPFGVCEDSVCVTNPVGTAEICNGFDPDPDFAEDPEPRCDEL